MEKEKISMKGGKYPQDFQEKLMTLSLNADIMSSMVLKNKKVAEEIINIVQNAINKGQKKKAKVHLELIRVQHSIRNWNGGRSIVIDFIAYCPEENKIYIIEPQCYWQKNIYCRNRYYGSMVDADSLQVGQDFSEMPKRCMIVLTEKDFNSKDPMIQHIKKVDLMSGNTVESGEEEIIVNLAAETDNSELGQFIRDWTNPNPDDIKNPVFAEALRYYKFNPKGVDKMYSMLEETRRESDLKYIGILLNHGLSVEEIAKETELDEAYVKKNTEQEILFLLFLPFLFYSRQPLRHPQPPAIATPAVIVPYHITSTAACRQRLFQYAESKKPAAFAAGNTKIKSKNLKLNKHFTSFLPPEPSMSVYKLSGLSRKSDCLSLHLVLRLLPVIQTDTYQHQSNQYDAES